MQFSIRITLICLAKENHETKFKADKLSNSKFWYQSILSESYCEIYCLQVKHYETSRKGF